MLELSSLVAILMSRLEAENEWQRGPEGSVVAYVLKARDRRIEVRRSGRSLQLVVAGTGRTETESVEALAAAIEEELSRCGE